ncbi:MAG TPA: hypothetical protein VJ045_07060 [Hyphomicrobiaceae bacterium]|nr:hypothetical protein [Hyphomicrobiaceae bacterium]
MGFQATVVQRKLEEAGFDSKQAYGLTAVLETQVISDLEVRLVTRDHLDAKLAELKVELIKWMGGLIGGSTPAIILALLRVIK